jgi:hypothetical protein
MAKKITLEELARLIADSQTQESELRKYFILDEKRSTPFSPVLAIDHTAVDVPNTPEAKARSDAALTGANWWSRLRRRVAFENRIAGGYDGPIIVSEGDSWFEYPILLDDVIDCLSKSYAILSLDEAGDTLDNMVREHEYMDAIADKKASILLLSAGGNDALGGGDLKRHLRNAGGAYSPADYLRPSFDRLLNHTISLYDGVFRELERVFPGLAIIYHGYDHPVPKNGAWLGGPMTALGIKDPAVQKGIAAEMVNRFNAALARLAQSYPNVTYLDVRNVVTDARWYDELHPNDDGFADVAKKFNAAIRKSAKTAKSPALPRGPEGTPVRFRSLPRGRRTLLAAPIGLAEPKRKGYSLHIGLNGVDPTHYAGWDGELAACEFDASDMASIAKALGYKGKTLLTKDATRQAVATEIKRAAKELKAGDIFFLTYSGHGGQIPDFNGDEEDNLDETWCLYDAQLVDDELYMLWTEFSEHVRIVVVSDSCHSGSVLKQMEEASPDKGSGGPAEARRAMPYRIAARVFRQNRDFYEKLGRSVGAIGDKILIKELKHPIASTVRLLAGCQDNQFSYDGMVNGAFTAILLDTWAQGRFTGNYAAFYSKIKFRMPARQTPNHWIIGAPNAAFDEQRPFEI